MKNVSKNINNIHRIMYNDKKSLILSLFLRKANTYTEAFTLG